MTTVQIQKVVTSGTFSLDGGTWEVDNNVWLVGDTAEVFVIDPAHDVSAICQEIGGRKVLGILLTHAHDDHIRAVLDFQAQVAQQQGQRPAIYLHPEDRILWDQVHAETAPDEFLHDGQIIKGAGIELQVVHTPGHSPGSVCYYAQAQQVVFSGDTLFHGGPGATGRSFSDFDTIIQSITGKLFQLPDDTQVHTGHGDSTTIGAERPDLQVWLDRGH